MSRRKLRLSFHYAQTNDHTCRELAFKVDTKYNLCIVPGGVGHSRQSNLLSKRPFCGTLFHTICVTVNLIVKITTQFLTLTPISLRSILTLSSHLCLGFPKSLYPISLPVNIFETLLPSSSLATGFAYFNIRN